MSSRQAMRRRRFLIRATAFGIAALISKRAAVADTFPSKPINFIIPFGTGGDFDVYGREFAHLLQKTIVPHVYVEPLNVPGAGGRKAIFDLLGDQPDGYNISLVSVPGIFMDKYQGGGSLNLDSLTWLANLGRDPYAMGVSVKGPIHSVADFQKISASRPVTFSNSGFASSGYLATRAFCDTAGIRCSIVSGYKGSSDSAVAVARGDVDAVVHSVSTLQGMAQAGLIRIVFVFEKTSSLPGIEDATTLNEPDLGEIAQWRPIAAPPSLPSRIATKLSTALVQTAKSKDTIAWADQTGATLWPLDQQQTLEMVHAQEALIQRWKSVLQG